METSWRRGRTRARAKKVKLTLCSYINSCRKTKLFHCTSQSWAERKEPGGTVEAGEEVASTGASAPELGRVMTSSADPAEEREKMKMRSK